MDHIYYHSTKYVVGSVPVGYMLILPCYFQGIVNGLKLVITAHLCCGEILALMFIVTHINEGCEFLDETHRKKESNNWAEMQVRTSINWSLDSFFWTHFSGGLNHQIEHHLFPGICHVHYAGISNIVKRVANDYDLPYNCKKSFIEAIIAHGKMLYFLGQDPK